MPSQAVRHKGLGREHDGDCPLARMSSERYVTDPHRGRDSAEASAEAYTRVKLSVREFAALRYGVARDPDGIFFFQASSIEISI